MMSYAGLLVNGCRNRLILGIKTASNAGLAATRNQLVHEALELDPTHLLFIDSDITVPHDVCQRLLRHQKDIVSGLYFTRRPPYVPVVRTRKEWVPGTEKLFLDAEPPKQFTEVGYIGFGCVMISAAVFRRALVGKEKPENHRFFSFSNEKDEGEDVFFCRQMHAQGEKMYLDPECECGHVGTYTVTRESFQFGSGQRASLG
jgi:GT2 family glycosyltransferase